jgi:ABC-type Fe3+ transport system permease subunit
MDAFVVLPCCFAAGQQQTDVFETSAWCALLAVCGGYFVMRRIARCRSDGAQGKHQRRDPGSEQGDPMSAIYTLLLLAMFLVSVVYLFMVARAPTMSWPGGAVP